MKIWKKLINDYFLIIDNCFFTSLLVVILCNDGRGFVNFVTLGIIFSFIEKDSLCNDGEDFLNGDDLLDTDNLLGGDLLDSGDFLDDDDILDTDNLLGSDVVDSGDFLDGDDFLDSGNVNVVFFSWQLLWILYFNISLYPVLSLLI